MARLRRWAASDTEEGCISTRNSDSAFSCFGGTYPLHTIRGGAVEVPIGTPKNEADKCLEGADRERDMGEVSWKAEKNGPRRAHF